MSRSRASLVAIPLAALTGAAGLSYEVLWARALTLQVGGPLAAFAIVVTSFMLGLSLGAVILGRLSDRLERPLKVFGLAQLGIGVLGVASIGAGTLIRMALLAAGPRPASPAFMIIEALAAGSLCAIPSFLMGGTLPLLMAAVRDAPPTLMCSRLAAANAAGAAAGSLAAGFFLLPAFGLRNSLLIVASTSLMAGVVALSFSSPLPPAGPRPFEGARGPAVAARALLVLALSGAALTALELVWARLAYLTFGSSTQAGSLVLAVIIAGVAAGNLLGARGGPTTTSIRLGWLALAAAGATLLSVPLLGRLPVIAVWLSALSGESAAGMVAVGERTRLALILATTGIPCLLIGALFPEAFRLLSASGGAVTDAARRVKEGSGALAGTASAAASLGNLAGAPAAYLALMTAAGSREIALAAALALCVCGIVAGGGSLRVTGIALASIAVTMGFAAPWDPAQLSSGPFLYGALYRGGSGSYAGILGALEERGEVVFSEEGPHALVTVRRDRAGHLSMQVNGKTDASTGGDMRTQTLLAQLPLLVHASARPAPADAMLVIGLGSGVSAGTALGHALRAVTIVEISPEVSAAATRFSGANHDVLMDPRTRLVIGDARSWLLFGDALYDVIASQPSNPWVAGEASLFTREFFALARGRLAEGGIMCQWVQGYGLDPEDFRSVVATFTSVFPHASLWEESTTGGDYLLLGSDAPMSIDPARLGEAMAAARVSADLERVEIASAADLLSLRITQGESLARYASGAALQTEDRLALEFSAPRALHRETLGAILAALEPARLDPSLLAAGNEFLARDLRRRGHEARDERAWASGLGLDRIRPIDAGMHQALGYLRAGMSRHALQLLTTLARERPGDELPHIVLAHLAMSDGATGDAVNALERAVALAPERVASRLYLSRALFAAGRIGEALRHNEAAIRLAPTSAEAFSDRCAMLLRLDDEPSAEAACRDALVLDPDLASAHANLGLVHARRGRDAEAETSYLSALDRDPSLKDARFNLASLYERQGRGTEGLVLLRPLLEAGPADGDLLRLAARLAMLSGDLPGATRWVEESLRLEPQNLESLDLARSLRVR